MVQGCDINIMDMKSSVSKSLKVAVPTEEQKRLAQLSHIERIDTLEDNIIKQMVEITKHSYDECAMELAGSNMDMESAITKLIEGNSEEWETKQKKVRPEKKAPPAAEPSDPSKPKRSSSKTERGRSTKPEDSRDSADISRGSARGARGASNTSRDGSRGASVARGVNGRGGAATSRGRGGKRQLPPRMDRQRGDEGVKPRFETDSRRSADSFRSGGRGGRSNGSYRHNNRGAKRPTENEAHDWGSSNGKQESEENTNYSAEWAEDLTSGGWNPETEDKSGGWNSEDTSGWGATEESVTAWEDKHEPSQPTTAAQENTWSKEQQEEQPTEVIPEVTSQWQSTTKEAPKGGKFDSSVTSNSGQFDMAHKRPAYTQAFSNSLSSILTSTEFAQSTSSSSFGFGFSQTPSSVSSDYNPRHEQAPGTSNLLKIQEALKNNSMTSARKISVEQLFQMHEKTASETAPIPEENGPSSPPTSSTSSTNSGRRSKRAQRTIPTEPVEMPGNAVESLDVQFGSIGFMDTSEEDCGSAGEKTPANKMDAATSTTPHSVVEPETNMLPGIVPISDPDTTRLLQSVPATVQSSPQSSAFQSNHPSIHSVSLQSVSQSLHSHQSAVPQQSVLHQSGPHQSGPHQSVPHQPHHSSHQSSVHSMSHPSHQPHKSPSHGGVHQVTPLSVSHQGTPLSVSHQGTPLSVSHQGTPLSVSHQGTPLSGSLQGTPLSVQQQAVAHQSVTHSVPAATSTAQSSASLHMSQSGLAQQPAPPPNLPPPNMDNIRNANSLITNRTLPEEVPQFGMKKSLPPGVYPTANLRSSANSFYYGEQSSVSSVPPQQQSQSSGYDARYYNTTSTNSYEGHHSHRQLQQQLSETAFSTGGIPEKQQHYTGPHRASEVQQQQQQQQLSTASHQPPHVGAGITSGISSTTAPPTGLGGGYPGPLLGYHYPIHPYPNNLYTANYYAHPFNPAALSYAQTQKPTVPNYPATNNFGSSGDSSTPTQFGGYETPEYKEVYTAANKHQHGTTMSHIPVTSSNEYSKMMGADKNVFNMGYMQFPNYIQHIQQGQGQAAALIQQQSGLQQQQQQRGVEQPRNPGASITPKHYWSHR